MKIKLFIFAAALLLMGCSKQDEPTCTCLKVYYDYNLVWTGQTAQGIYTKTNSEPSADCNKSANYVRITNSKFYKIECN
jgi:major membrane immunogen (membrane-anchored lipoprotein)